MTDRATTPPPHNRAASFFLILASLHLTILTSSTTSSAFFTPKLPSKRFSMTSSSSTTAQPSDDEEDPYSFLEDVDGPQSLQFARDANDACLAALGDPRKSPTKTYDRVLKVLESEDRIPHVGKYGVNEEGEAVLFNFWKDGTNPKGLWRKTTLSSYRTPKPTWTTILDIDELGKRDSKTWVWKGAAPLPRSRDPIHSNDHVTRALVKLSDGGADAIIVREFDVLKGEFVTEEDDGFDIGHEAKTRVSYRSRDVLSVGTDFGPNSLTDSGYPRTIREWTRGTNLADAPIIFEGEKTDVSVSVYVDDQRHRSGPIYEVRYRSLDFYNSTIWARRIAFEHLLSPDDPGRVGAGEPEEFVLMDVPSDAEVDFYADWMLIWLRSDWELSGKAYKQGSLLAVKYESFVGEGKDRCDYQMLFEPAERTALETYSSTKRYLILEVLDNVKSKLIFFKHDESSNGGTLEAVYGQEEEARIRSMHVGAFDPRECDLFWFTTSGFTQPSTLYLADVEKISDCSSSSERNDPFIVEKFKSLPPQYDSDNIKVVQRFATSEDGTEIPYFLICREDKFEAGQTPTLMYGYGGFEITLSPHYVATSGIAWLERGGAYVEANIRGGGEFGPSWHQAGLKENRNKCFEDFIAVGEDLISSGLCTPSTLAIRGGSNGGLLVGNMLTMRPDLFGAIHCAVPLLDMKKYHTLLAGASWMAEYGNPDTDDWDKFLHRYSPYHNVDPEKDYPPILFTTSTRDDRVHPAHARKMVKKLWDADERKQWKVYYYENIEGGHGGAADSKQSAFMTTLAYDFLWNTLTKHERN